MRIVTKRRGQKKNKPPQIQYQLSFVGTAWCIVQNKYLLTAHHILNNLKPRDPNDKFFAFIVPNNGLNAFHFPVVAFPLEDAASDMAILEIGSPVNHTNQIPSVPITFNRPIDGSMVFTYGFPAPAINKANVDQNGNFAGGEFFLKAHANEGILAAQYEINNQWFCEFNVGWHHGESGGPVFQLDPLAGFAVMQQYRNVQTPLGPVAGPHAGRSLECVKAQLISIGCKIV